MAIAHPALAAAMETPRRELYCGKRSARPSSPRTIGDRGAAIQQSAIRLRYSIGLTTAALGMAIALAGPALTRR
jgi:hypothetical protein